MFSMGDMFGRPAPRRPRTRPAGPSMEDLFGYGYGGYDGCGGYGYGGGPKTPRGFRPRTAEPQRRRRMRDEHDAEAEEEVLRTTRSRSRSRGHTPCAAAPRQDVYVRRRGLSLEEEARRMEEARRVEEAKREEELKRMEAAACVITAAIRRAAAVSAACRVTSSLRLLRVAEERIGGLVKAYQSNPRGYRPTLWFADQVEREIEKLDGIPTHGNLFVRAARKAIVADAQRALRYSDVVLATLNRRAGVLQRWWARRTAASGAKSQRRHPGSQGRRALEVLRRKREEMRRARQAYSESLRAIEGELSALETDAVEKERQLKELRQQLAVVSPHRRTSSF